MSYLCNKHHSHFLVNPVLKDYPEIIEFMLAKKMVALPLTKDGRLYEAIEGHPDIVGCPVFSKTILEERVYQNHKKDLEEFEIETGESLLSKNYPYNISYNVAVFGEFAIHSRWIDPLILKELKKRRISSLLVNQGYSKCSIVVVDSKSIITSDLGIYRSCKNSLNVLVVSVWKEIFLPGLDYGFLGGSSLTRGEEIYFTGDISKHPDYLLMKEFAEKRGKKLVSMKQGRLIDVGGFLPLYKKKRVT